MSEQPPKKVVEDSKEAKKIDALMREAEAAEVKPPQIAGNSKEAARIDAFMREAEVAEIKPLQTAEEETEKEGTPKEWRDRLRGLVGKLTGGAQEKIDNAKERVKGWMSERGEKSSNNLAERSSELSAEAEKLGWVEKSFRTMGETYNKLSTREKIGVGVALGLGAGGLAAASLPVSWMFLGGVATQRIAGLASMYLKYEKSSIGEKEKKDDSFWRWGASEKAMMKAIGKQALMTAGTIAFVEGVKESVQWLSHHLNSAPEVPGTSPLAPSPVHEVPPVPEAPAASLPAPEMPQVSVEASGGHGYEYMAKRLWEQLQDKGLNPSDYAEDSDIHKLLSADAASINKVVHQIASDPQHGFYNADATNVLISPDAHMTIGADGQIHLGDAVHAPEGAATTPAYHPEAHVAPPPVEKPFSLTDEDLADRYRETPPVETSVKTLPETQLPFTSHPGREMHLSVHEMPTAPVPDTAPATPIDHIPEEAPSPSPVVSPHESLSPFTANADNSIITTAFGLEVPINEPHLYAGWEDGQVFVYGGSSPVERAKMILEYLQEHPKEVVYSAADNGEHRIPWHLEDGRAVPDLPVHQNHFFGFFRSFMKAPEPTDLRELIPTPTHHVEAPVVPHITEQALVETPVEAPPTQDVPAHTIEPVQSSEHSDAPVAGVSAVSGHEAVQRSSDVIQGHLEYGAEEHHLTKNWLDEVREHTTDAKSRLAGERVVRIKAQELELYERQLKAMQERGNDGTATYEALKKKISLVIEQVERKYGNVFNDKFIK